MFQNNGVKVVFGTGTIGASSDHTAGFTTPEQAQEVFDLFRAWGGSEIDSARGYSPNAPGTSEPIVGGTDVSKWATIATKVSSRPGEHTKAGIEESTSASLKALNIKSLDINYLHHPDPNTPLEETIAAMDAEYRSGRIKNFGISNYTVDKVREILAICEEKGYVKPSVYQGQYNAVARKAEDELIPLLRENGIKFYAWSPAAGGVFNGKSMRQQGDNAFAKIWNAMYEKPEMATALQRIGEQEEKAGINGHELALRWILNHSVLRPEHGDAIIIGARTLDQMKSTLKYCETGPLPQAIVDLVEEIWTLIAPVAPAYHPTYSS